MERCFLCHIETPMLKKILTGFSIDMTGPVTNTAELKYFIHTGDTAGRSKSYLCV